MKELDYIKINKIAEDILKYSRNSLLVNLRFLDRALSQFRFVPNHMDLATDGRNFFYPPLLIIKNFKAEKEKPTRDYLHMVLHCVYRHMFTGFDSEMPLWNLSCDIAVENIINELDISSAQTSYVKKQQDYVNTLKEHINMITAEKVYSYLKSSNLSEHKLKELSDLFYADSHDVWYMSDEDKLQKYDDSSEGENQNQREQSQNGQSQGRQDQGSSHQAVGKKELQQIWADISDRMQVDMETFSKQKGDIAGAMMQNLREVNREKYDYSSFLKKFAVLGEAMQINDDEFDYIFYTYGLKLFKKMPLIEPLEYKDIKRIKEFVIAVDTSSSTEGELVQTFLQKTFNMLKSTETFFTKINIHIIQCDAEIQEDVQITNQEEFDNYIKTMKIKGMGGTDFRPVFNFVQNLIQRKEFTNLNGLIYFTDGQGDFPNTMPSYKTAFVFIDDDYNNYDVPPWAIKLVLKKDEI